MEITFIVAGKEIIVEINETIQSQYIKDLMSHYQNVKISVPDHYTTIINFYLQFLKAKYLYFHDAIPLAASFRLASYFLDEKYFHWLLNQSYKLWTEVYPHIKDLPSDIQKEIFLHTPYHFVPWDIMSDSFFKLWLDINQGKVITLNGDEEYHTVVEYRNGYKTFTSFMIIDEEEVGNKYIKTWHLDNGQLKEDLGLLNDEKHGLCREWYHDGQLQSEIMYNNGDEDGVSRTWYNNGNLEYEANYVDGNLHGVEREWYTNGQLKFETNYVNGSECGVRAKWFEDGYPSSQEEVVNGGVHGFTRIWHPNSLHVAMEGNKVHGMMDGLWKFYYEEDGQPKSESTYRNDHLCGIWREWYPNNGKLWKQGEWALECKKVGTWVEWDENGFLTSMIEYGYPTSKKIFKGVLSYIFA